MFGAYFLILNGDVIIAVVVAFLAIAKRTIDVMTTQTNKLEWWMILKISLWTNAGVPKHL